MKMLSHITVSELQTLSSTANLSPETRLTVIFEDGQVGAQAEKRLKSLAAMIKLKGSGNGNLVNALLQDRAQDQ